MQQLNNTQLINILIILFSCLLLGCGKQQEYSTYKIIFANEVNKKPIISKKIDNIIRPDFISKVDDRIFVLSSVSDTIVYEYDLNMSYIRNWGKKGHGPDEVSNFLMFCKGDSADQQSLYLWGTTPITITKYSKGDENIFKKNKNIQLPYYAPFNYLSISEGVYFYYFDIDQLLIKKINIESAEEEKISLEIDKDDRSSAFYTNRGVMDINNTYIVYAYMYKNQIDIYDKKSLKLKKKYILEENGLKTDQYDLTRYYTNVIATNEFIYVYKVDNKERHIIEIYDFDGNPILKNILETPIPLFTIDETNHTMIGFNFSDEDFAYIYTTD